MQFLLEIRHATCTFCACFFLYSRVIVRYFVRVCPRNILCEEVDDVVKISFVVRCVVCAFGYVCQFFLCTICA
ncbi:hypothetical protein HMPREF0091_10564 [Fannyhessea vaginae DSM 15829]|uniref:Uncharacterized protein n=1 Tax=Fannyhessea vaginae DSM 15829 TaxID=525256 RepID=F1T4H3_9ACTN|nr:hypothetical protein HMPREF0091_10564 [Fannyhessea vaginae DSM 15829]